VETTAIGERYWTLSEVRERLRDEDLIVRLCLSVLFRPGRVTLEVRIGLVPHGALHTGWDRGQAEHMLAVAGGSLANRETVFVRIGRHPRDGREVIVGILPATAAVIARACRSWLDGTLAEPLGVVEEAADVAEVVAYLPCDLICDLPYDPEDEDD
jgi:hypothetical protein